MEVQRKQNRLVYDSLYQKKVYLEGGYEMIMAQIEAEFKIIFLSIS